MWAHARAHALIHHLCAYRYTHAPVRTVADALLLLAATRPQIERCVGLA
jgi:hypothetical protein